MKFSGKISSGPINNSLNLDGNAVQGCGYGSRSIYVTLVRRALVDAYTVPVLLV